MQTTALHFTCMLTLNLNLSQNHSHHPSLQGKKESRRSIHKYLFFAIFLFIVAREFIKIAMLKGRLREVTSNCQRLTAC